MKSSIKIHMSVRAQKRSFQTGHRRLLFCLVLVSLSKGFAQSFFNYVEFKNATTLTLPTEESGKEKAVTTNTGLALSFKNIDARGYITLPKTTFSEIEEAHSLTEKIDLLNDPRYGLGISLFTKTAPTTLKIGTNTYSRSISKLKNPSPSTTANPLVKSFAFSTGIGASLPTLTSSVQPVSYAVSLHILPITLESFVTEEGAAAASISTKYSFSKVCTVKGAFSFARFFIENTSSILKKNDADFNADWFYSGLAEVSFHSPILKANLYAGIQQSPYTANPVWFRIDTRTYLKMILLNFSYFSIPNADELPKVAPLIGGSSSICRMIEQASVNPQILFLFDDKNASSVRLGFSALENRRVTATNTPVQIQTAKFRAGLAYENRFFSARFDWTHANMLLEGEPPTKSSTPEEYQSFALSSSYIGKIAKYSLSGSYAHYPPVTSTSVLKEVYSADAKIAVPKLNLTTQTGIDLTYKDGERYSAEFDASVTYTIRRKSFRSSVKVGLAMPF